MFDMTFLIRLDEKEYKCRIDYGEHFKYIRISINDELIINHKQKVFTLNEFYFFKIKLDNKPVTIMLDTKNEKYDVYINNKSLENDSEMDKIKIEADEEIKDGFCSFITKHAKDYTLGALSLAFIWLIIDFVKDLFNNTPFNFSLYNITKYITLAVLSELLSIILNWFKYYKLSNKWNRFFYDYENIN